jgi:hypothetical protein
MKQLAQYLLLFILIYIIEIRQVAAQKYSFDLGLVQDSSTIQNLNIRETIAINGNDTIFVNRYDLKGLLTYKMEYHVQEKFKTYKRFDAIAEWHQTFRIEKNQSLDTINFKDGTILTSELQPNRDTAIQFHLPNMLSEISPNLEKLSPYLNFYSNYKYHFDEVNEHGDTAKVNVYSTCLDYVDYNIFITKDYGICFDSLRYIENYFFKTKNELIHKSYFKRSSKDNSNIMYENTTTYKNGLPYEVIVFISILPYKRSIHFLILVI